MIKISIIMPCRNEQRHIEFVIDSIASSDLNPKEFELLCVDGDSEDTTKEIINRKSRDYSFIKLLHNPQKTVPYAMNIGIKASKGDYIFRIDAHSSYPHDYFTNLMEWHRKLNADNVGGICVTDVKNKTKKTIAIKKVLSDKLGVGNSLFRIGTDTVKEVDTVPFGCYKKDVFEKYGLYDTRLTRNQDIEINKRIARRGGKVYLVPDVHCTYYARETFRGLAKNNFENGLWNILTAYYTGSLRSLSLRHFIPFLFVSFIFVSGVLSIIFPFPWIIIILVTIVAIYLLSLLMRSILINKGKTTIMHLMYAFIVLHFSYGTGSILGLLKVLWKVITQRRRN